MELETNVKLLYEGVSNGHRKMFEDLPFKVGLPPEVSSATLTVRMARDDPKLAEVFCYEGIHCNNPDAIDANKYECSREGAVLLVRDKELSIGFRFYLQPTRQRETSE